MKWWEYLNFKLYLRYMKYRKILIAKRRDEAMEEIEIQFNTKLVRIGKPLVVSHEAKNINNIASGGTKERRACAILCNTANILGMGDMLAQYLAFEDIPVAVVHHWTKKISCPLSLMHVTDEIREHCPWDGACHRNGHTRIYTGLSGDAIYKEIDRIKSEEPRTHIMVYPENAWISNTRRKSEDGSRYEEGEHDERRAEDAPVRPLGYGYLRYFFRTDTPVQVLTVVGMEQLFKNEGENYGGCVLAQFSEKMIQPSDYTDFISFYDAVSTLFKDTYTMAFYQQIYGGRNAERRRSSSF